MLPPVETELTAEVVGMFGLDDCFVGATYLAEPVPTDVEVAPNKTLFVTLLPGGPGLPGSASVWKVDARTGAATSFATGFTSAVDLAVAPNGTVYVAELDADQITLVTRRGEVRPYVSVPSPGAVEVDHRGRLHATTNVFGNGTLVRIG